MRILMPRVVVEETRFSFYTNFHAGLMEAARELGHEPVPFDIARMNEASAAEAGSLLRLLNERPCDIALDMCCWGSRLSNLQLQDGAGKTSLIFDAFQMPYVGMLYDQPWNQALSAIMSSRLYASVPDRHFVELIGFLYPRLEVKGFAFAPPATRLKNNYALPWAERSIDVLFVGNFESSVMGRFWRQFPDPEPLDDTVDQILLYPEQPLLHAAHESIQAAGIEPHPELVKELLYRVDMFLRIRYRFDAVKAVASSGATIHVVGQGWENLDLPPNIVLHPPVDYDGMLALAGQSRICLDSSNYPGGANDRVFNYAANGAVCYTNVSEFPLECFGSDNGLRFYSMLELDRLGESVRAALAEPDRLRAEGERAAQIALSTQTWRPRLEAILETVRQGAM